jgi:hypothetical protein
MLVYAALAVFVIGIVLMAWVVVRARDTENENG